MLLINVGKEHQYSIKYLELPKNIYIPQAAISKRHYIIIIR